MSVIASANSQTPPAFNATFYATVAVIIPVLYLALVVQGGGLDALLQEGLSWFKSIYMYIRGLRHVLMNRIERPRSTTPELVAIAVVISPFFVLAVVVTAVAMTIAACLIAVAGAVSELCALYALYKQDAVINMSWNASGPNPISISVNVSYVVLASTGILIVATTVLPFAQLIGRVRRGKPESPAKPPAKDKPSPDDAS